MTDDIDTADIDPASEQWRCARAENLEDDEILRYLSILPNIAGQDDGTMTMRDLTYEICILPFIKDLWQRIPESPGPAGRLKKLVDVYARAEAAYLAHSGQTRRVPRQIDLEKFLRMYYRN